METILKTDNASEAIDKINSNFSNVGTSGDSTSTDIVKRYAALERNRGLISAMSNATFLFFTDIHIGWTNMARIAQLANAWSSDGCLNAVLNGGDNINIASNNRTSYYTYMDRCTVDILMSMGNHDYLVDSSELYTDWIAPMTSRYSDLIQPTNAVANSLCYYYKDFNDVRIISFDTPGRSTASYLTAENTWLQEVLADAITNGKYVIILTHYPFLEANANKIDCSWSNHFEHAYLPDALLAGQTIPDSTCDIVDDFIDNGGNFVCWLTGHAHRQGFFTNTLHPRQAMLNLGTANYEKNIVNLFSETNLNKFWQEEADNLYDNLCYIGVNTSRKNVFMMKIGTNIDRWIQKHDILVWDFANAKMITCY